MPADVAAHTETIHMDDVELIDAHAPRSESPLFRRNRALLIARIGKCWVDNDICATGQPLEAHHLHEWSQADKADWARLHDALLTIDPYGYSHAQAGQPISDVDDLRNLMLICPTHHRKPGVGIHGGITFPELVEMKARRPGAFITEAEAQCSRAVSATLSSSSTTSP